MPSVVDAIIVLILLVVAWNGFRTGFLLELASLARAIVGILAGIRLFPIVAMWITRAVNWPQALANLAGFIVIFLLAHVAVTAIYAFTVYPSVRTLHRVPGLGCLDRVAGMVPAAVQALFWCAFALSVLLLLPVGSGIQGAITNSALGNALVVDLSTLEPRLQTVLGDAARDTLLYVTPPATSTEGTVQLHFPPGLSLATDQQAEQTMLDFVNQQRRQRGLPVLRWDPALTSVARAHSTDMFRQGYFSHTSPQGGSPFDRMQAASIKYTAAGENIAYAPNVTIADTGLMNSPEHRANILRPEFSRVGIGVISGGLFEEMFTQDFAS